VRVDETGEQHRVTEVDVLIAMLAGGSDVSCPEPGDATRALDQRSVRDGRRRDGDDPSRVIARHYSKAPVREP
jgi:hypothetical protein